MKTLVTAAISMPVDASAMEGINFLNMPEAILVFAHEVLPRWLPLVERDGERYVDAPERQCQLSKCISEFQAHPSTLDEVANLKSHFATSSWRDRSKASLAFV